jgi:MFS family permease
MPQSTFRRDRATILLYFLLALYAYLQSIIAPAMNFVAREQGLTDTLRGFHLSAFSVGVVFAGISAERIAARIGRPRTVWRGCFLMAGGILLLTFGQTTVITMLSTLIMGFVGACALIMQQALLSDRHPTQRAIPLTEANVVAIIFAASAPFLVGIAASSVGWRIPLLLGASLIIVYWAIGRTWIDDKAPAIKAEHSAPKSRTLPLRYWIYWSVAFFGVAVEWSMIFWSAAYLERVGGLTTTDATSASTIFLFGMVIGRIIAIPLTRRTDPTRLLVVSIGMAIFGFSTFWLAPQADLRLVGLGMCGLGIANIWPLTLPTATGLVPHATDLANARMTLSFSLSTLIVPQVLGSLADVVGIQSAMLVVAAMLFFALMSALAGMTLKQ